MLAALIVIVALQLSLGGCKGNVVWDVDKIEIPGNSDSDGQKD
jgi:hypothetical protein